MKLKSAEIKKIAIFRALQLGDMLCIVPAIRSLRKSFPTAEITLISLPWAQSFSHRFTDYFDSFICFPGFPGLPEQSFDPKDFTSFLTEVQDREFDLVLQMQGDGSLVNPLVELFGSKLTAGYYKEGHYYPNNDLYLKYPESGHEIVRHLKLVEFLDIPSSGTNLEFPIHAKDLEDFEKADLGLQAGKYVCVHPGSRGTERRWPTEFFAKLGDLAAEKGLTVVITGTKEELELAQSVAKHMKYDSVIAAGRTSIGAVAVLIQNSFALISNCTGVSHIASALEKRSIVINLSGESERWSPLNKELHKSVDWINNPDFNLVYYHTSEMLEESLVN